MSDVPVWGAELCNRRSLISREILRNHAVFCRDRLPSGECAAMPTPRSGPHPLSLYGAFLGCALIWGSTFLVISVGNDVFPPYWAATLRVGLAALLLVLIGALTGNSLPRGPALQSAAGYGLFTLGINMGLLYWAEKTVPSGLAAVFYATVPLTSTFLTRAFGMERITWAKVGAATISLIGVAVIFSGQLAERVPLLPLVALFIAATCGGLGNVLLKRGPRQNPIGANAVGNMVGFVVCLIFSFATRERHVLPRTGPEILPILYLTIAGSVGAFVLVSWLVNHWDVTRISFVSVIVPIIALILGAMIRHERMGWPSLVGSALVLAGVLIRIVSDRRAAQASPH